MGFLQMLRSAAFRESAGSGGPQAAASQYPELNGLLIRSANGDTSNNLSVGIFSPDSVAISMPEIAGV
jgi:hypothetical protein